MSKHTENDLAIQVKKIVCMLAINARNVLSWQYFKQHIASYDPVKYTVAGGASQSKCTFCGIELGLFLNGSQKMKIGSLKSE